MSQNSSSSDESVPAYGAAKQPYEQPTTHTSTLIDYNFKINVINKMLNNTELTLNTIQIINFLNYYFGETDAQEDTEQHDKLAICFPCIACSTKFAYEPTFHLHLDRRSMFIKILCIECNQQRVFYNKCKLFYHIYSHKASIFEPMYKQIQIECLPMDKCLPISSKYTDSLNFIFTSLQMLCKNPVEFPANELDPKNINLLINKKFKLNEQDCAQIKHFIKRIQINKYLVYKCYACDAVFFDPKDLKLHFVQSKKCDTDTGRFYYKQLKDKYKKITPCLNEEFLNEFDAKRLQFTNKCFQLMNIKLIDKKFKFMSRNTRRDTLVCPECGLIFDSSLSHQYDDYFKLHLKYDCLFTLRYDLEEFKCPLCALTFESVNDILNHWLHAHLFKKHTCNLCELTLSEKCNRIDCLSMDIKSEMHRHFYEKHNNAPLSLTTKYICDCRSGGLEDDKCQEFQTIKAFKSHLIDQINKSILSIDCYLCKKLILVKDYVMHVKSEHVNDKFYICPQCGPCVNQEPTFHLHVLRNHLANTTSDLTTYYCFKSNQDVYLCLNCRLFFNETKFCHNCWVPTQSSMTNYFSPIYLKFNVAKLINKFNLDAQDVIVIRDDEPSSINGNSNKKIDFKNVIRRMPNGEFKIVE